MVLELNPFFLDLSVNSGLLILCLIIALAVFLFFKKAFKFAGILMLFTGLLLLFNGINFLIALIFFVIGIMVIFMDT